MNAHDLSSTARRSRRAPTLEQVFAAIITKTDDIDGLHWHLTTVYRLLAEGFLTDLEAERLRAAADSRRSELRRMYAFRSVDGLDEAAADRLQTAADKRRGFGEVVPFLDDEEALR